MKNKKKEKERMNEFWGEMHEKYENCYTYASVAKVYADIMKEVDEMLDLQILKIEEIAEEEAKGE